MYWVVSGRDADQRGHWPLRVNSILLATGGLDFTLYADIRKNFMHEQS